jgi:hypothetical protein
MPQPERKDYRAVEFRDCRRSQLLHNAIMTATEVGEYLFRNSYAPPMRVVVKDEVRWEDVAGMTDEDRGVAHE